MDHIAAYSGPPSVNPYWYYDPHVYQPNVSVSYNPNISVNTPPHPSFEMYNNSRFADSGYLSRTPTPPTPLRLPSPQPVPIRQDNEENSTDLNGSLTHRPTFVADVDARTVEKPVAESKARLPYVKRTRIQYTLQQLQTLEAAFQQNHYPEVTTVDALAELLDVRHEKVSIWFQNRRSRFKRQQKPKASSSTIDVPKKHSVPSVASSSSYDPSTACYPPYFWPSPVVDARTSAYGMSSHTPSYYDNASSPMWNTNSIPYPSPSTWDQS
ncbi:unnamed protein product [Adineta ricciae]|uniref:Homeobox domain-containing protein n=1 Tax=Adineta ricciae TaxID=249248 RepID=A0A813MTZ8_ADIRI|nr:unnamed protein product [Adineta ricciae]CAF0931300.1 unnamed protein product [Adineta ricciae]